MVGKKIKMLSQKNIVMIKKARPEKVMLPNGRTFIARYEIVKYVDLSANVHLKSYPLRAVPKGKQRRRRRVNQQRGPGLGSFLRLAKNAVKNPLVKKLGRGAMSRLPSLYSKGTSKIKNKKLKRSD